MALSAGARVGAYQIVAPLGAGGMGEVYRAHDPKLHRDVALKILPDLLSLDADRRARFEREAQLLASLNHPNIAAIYGVEESGAIVMEMVEGPTLADRLTRGAVPIDEALTIALQLTHALEAAHEKGIVHRDLKPANIKVKPDGTVKVLDFGLAKTLDLSSSDASPHKLADSPTVSAIGTRAGVILGTAAYMSPEQARGQTVDARTDIWALGCVLFEMLTGTQTFGGATLTDVLSAVVSREPAWTALPPDTPDAARRLLRRCLEKTLNKRLRHVGDAQLELLEAQTPRTSQPRTNVGSRGRGWIIAAGVACVLAGAGLYHALRPGLASADRWSTAQITATQLTNYGQSETDPAISPDGRSFVFVSDHGGTTDLWLRHVAGGEPVRLTNDASIEDGPVYAPDGDTIYFARLDSNGWSIWRMGAHGGQSYKVIDGRLPAISRDSRSLAFLRDGPDNATLMVTDLAGGSTRSLMNGILGGALAYAPAWSPDGRRISIVQFGLFAPWNLIVIDVGSGQSRQVTHFTKAQEGVASHVWLPDNRHLVVAFVPFRRQQALSDLGILDVEDGSIQRLTMAVGTGLSGPSLSADGSRLIATATQYQRDVWRIPLGPDPVVNGRSAVRILDGTWEAMWTFVTRDGRTLLFNSPLSGSRNLWTMPVDASESPRQITSIPDDALAHSSLSPDGKRVAFASIAAGSSDIWIQNVDGSNLRQLTNDDAADAWPVWSPDGEWLAYNSLRGGRQETWRISVETSRAEKIVDGFFRGDWIGQPDGSGTWIVTSTGPGAFRLVDVEQRSIVWEQRRSPDSLSMPCFSADGRLISLPLGRGRDRTDIVVADSATGSMRVLAHLPFSVLFRASWIDNGKALLVNRDNTTSHIVMFDRFTR